MENRYIWIDIAKLSAIILVVLGHVWRGLHDAGTISAHIFTPLDTAVYAFHMPLFFIISGILFFKTYDRQWGIFLKRQAIFVIWPYIIWSAILILMKTALSSSVNNGASFYDLTTILYQPFSIFWFLYIFFIAQIFLKFVYERTESILLLLVIGTGLLLSSFLLDLSAMPVIDLTAKFLIYFILGFAIAKSDIMNTIKASNQNAATALVILIAVQSVILLQAIDLQSAFMPLAGVILSLCTIIMCLWLGARDVSRAVPLITYISTSTLAIYVAHTICTAGTRIVLMKLGIDAPALHVTLGVAAGIIAPLCLYDVAIKFKLTKWLGLGAVKPQQQPLLINTAYAFAKVAKSNISTWPVYNLKRLKPAPSMLPAFAGVGIYLYVFAS